MEEGLSKKIQRKEEVSPSGHQRKRKTRNGKYNAAERAMEQRDELIAQITTGMSEVHIDREPDDQAAWASDNAIKDLAVVMLERKRRTLAEIEAALRLIKEGKYGM